jgi:molybdate transport repressor ModE-like protein
MEIDPRHLRLLRSIAEHGSFTRAAATRRISQPAMSAGIALLEKQLGVRVVERGRHGAQLNEFGHLLLRHARGLDALLEQAKAEVDLKGIFVTAGVPFPESCWACDSLMALKSLVTHADCVSILPRHAIALEARTGILRKIRLRDVASKRQIGTTTLRTRALSPLADRFLAALRRVASGIA